MTTPEPGKDADSVTEEVLTTPATPGAEALPSEPEDDAS